jgi:hypothetical protein
MKLHGNRKFFVQSMYNQLITSTVVIFYFFFVTTVGDSLRCEATVEVEPCET